MVFGSPLYFYHYKDYHYKQKHPAETRRPLIGLRFGASYPLKHPRKRGDR